MAAPLLAALAMVTGCSSSGGGPGVANLGPSKGPSGSTSRSAGGSALAYSQCMRAHGVPAFPDPGPNGELRLQAGPGTGIDPNSSTFKAAERACQSLRPTVSAEQQHKSYEAELKFSKCMRAHGVTQFPDPQPDGRMQIQAKPGTGLDPQSSLFQAAQRACQKYLPGGKGLPAETNDQGKG